MLALALLAIVPLRFHYDASEFTNAVYHVNCLTNRISCTNSVFARFWNDQYHVTREDGAQLDAWLEVMRKLENAAPPPPSAPLLPNYGSFYPSMRARYQVITNAVESRSSADFRRRVSKFLSDADSARLSQVLDHFQRRLHPWWESNGRRTVEVHIRKVKRRMAQSNLLPLASEVARFVGAKSEDRDVYVHAIPGPFLTSKDASATVISNHFFVEVLPADRPDDTVWKAMHELTHAFYDSAPTERHLSLMSQFAASKQPRPEPFYAYLNEAIATSVQLLVYERLGLTDDDPYHHPYIPRLAMSTLPLLRQALSNGGSLYEGFVEPYLLAGAAELKQETNNPQFLLATVGVLASEKNQKASEMFFERFHPRFFLNTEAEWRLFTGLTGVRLMTYDELAPFSGQIENLEGLVRNQGFAYIAARPGKGNVYFLAGRDTEAIVDVVKQLAKTSSVPGEGLIFVVSPATAFHPAKMPEAYQAATVSAGRT
jgi:hypothetical protein